MKKIYLILFFVGSVLFPCCADKKTEAAHMDRASYYNDLIKSVINVTPKQLDIKLPDDEITVYGVVTEQNIGDFFIAISAFYSTGEAVDIAYGGNCYVNAGEKGLAGGVSKLLYATAGRYLQYYDDDVKKYWKDKSQIEVSRDLLMTSFVDGNNDTGLIDIVKDFINFSQGHINSLTNVETTENFPDAGEVKIIFLTNKGRFFVQDKTEKITSEDSGFAALFKKKGILSEAVFQNSYAFIKK